MKKDALGKRGIQRICFGREIFWIRHPFLCSPLLCGPAVGGGVPSEQEGDEAAEDEEARGPRLTGDNAGRRPGTGREPSE